MSQSTAVAAAAVAAAPKRVLVVGAGISGLALAHYLQRTMGSGVHVTIAEKGKRVGGWMKTAFFHGARRPQPRV
jgi:protoporphyrinogen oxidase